MHLLVELLFCLLSGLYGEELGNLRFDVCQGLRGRFSNDR
jgi:hypothetical protein